MPKVLNPKPYVQCFQADKSVGVLAGFGIVTCVGSNLLWTDLPCVYVVVSHFGGINGNLCRCMAANQKRNHILSEDK